MTDGKFFHIYLRPKSGITSEQIEEKKNLSVDWYHYDTHVWIVYSTFDAHKLLARFKPLVEPGGNIFICELNTQNRNGWMPKALWNWFKQDRSN
jgi:hypothetical protein